MSEDFTRSQGFRVPLSASLGGLSLRPARVADRDRILAWNNDPDVRARSLDPRPIDPDAHARWLAARLEDPRARLSIVVERGESIGLIRIERRTPDGPGRISIVLAAAARGRGFGRAAIAAACRADGGEILAEIVADNFASHACFRGAGFGPVPAARAAALVAAFGPCRPGVHRTLWSSS